MSIGRSPLVVGPPDTASLVLHLRLEHVAPSGQQLFADLLLGGPSRRPVEVVEFLHQLERPPSIDDVAPNDATAELGGHVGVPSILQGLGGLAEKRVGVTHLLMEVVQAASRPFDPFQRLGGLAHGCDRGVGDPIGSSVAVHVRVLLVGGSVGSTSPSAVYPTGLVVGSAVVSDRADFPDRTAPGEEVEVDVADFLPEGASLLDGAVEDGGDRGGRPNAGLGGVEEPTELDQPGPMVDQALVGQEPVDQVVDLAVLTRLEGDLAAVDAALEAIDVDEYERSALLTELLSDS